MTRSAFPREPWVLLPTGWDPAPEFPSLLVTPSSAHADAPIIAEANAQGWKTDLVVPPFQG
jgi:hypothetical protein